MITNSVTASVSDDLNAHKRLLETFKKELKGLPTGRVSIKKIRGADRCYRYIPSGTPGIRAAEIYLRKSDEKLRAGLCRRRFIEKSLPIIEKIVKLEEVFLENYSQYDPAEVVNRLPKAYQDLNYNPIIDMTEQNHPSLWMNEPYEKNTRYLDKLIHMTPNGLCVRSKSESIIAGILESANIPFRYEALLILDGNNYYPDFTILNPQNNQIVYWEHFGMVDNENYAAAMDRKLSIFKKHGILQWENLITTYETGKNPLNAQQIRKVIRAFLLPDKS